ncbi:uncharacterized protein LOC128215294 [Mya arenaria]|uniref:uncharacterized protein LOC128215294 n=1 Tax=Mya arenaria TaxID=6604 RepID=UPI0022E8FF38|nr:uncharacterized protein LOC128215294 [Mya arenaria]
MNESETNHLQIQDGLRRSSKLNAENKTVLDAPMNTKVSFLDKAIRGNKLTQAYNKLIIHRASLTTSDKSSTRPPSTSSWPPSHSSLTYSSDPGIEIAVPKRIFSKLILQSIDDKLSDRVESHMEKRNDFTDLSGEEDESRHSANSFSSSSPERVTLTSRVADLKNIHIGKEIETNVNLNPDTISLYNWQREPLPQRIFECVRMQTISSSIRICIHPISKDPEVSSYLKFRGTWEFEAVRDMQLALVDVPGSGLIDVGAGIGTFSLTAASLNRSVLAVEPFLSHIQVFHRSVILNHFENNIQLIKNVVSDNQEEVIVQPKESNINTLNITQRSQHTFETTESKLFTKSITLDDLADICPFKTAVLKLDIPGFNKRALEHSDKLFNNIHITHVLLHWNTSDYSLCHFYLDFFKNKGFEPYRELVGSQKLDTNWPDGVIIWKKMFSEQKIG